MDIPPSKNGLSPDFWATLELDDGLGLLSLEGPGKALPNKGDRPFLEAVPLAGDWLDTDGTGLSGDFFGVT